MRCSLVLPNNVTPPKFHKQEYSWSHKASKVFSSKVFCYVVAAVKDEAYCQGCGDVVLPRDIITLGKPLPVFANRSFSSPLNLPFQAWASIMWASLLVNFHHPFWSGRWEEKQRHAWRIITVCVCVHLQVWTCALTLSLVERDGRLSLTPSTSSPSSSMRTPLPSLLMISLCVCVCVCCALILLSLSL